MKKSVEYFIKPKRGQITIFIVLAIIIVAALLVYFLWIRPTYTAPETGNFGFEGCVEDTIRESVEKLGMQGGFANPESYYEYGTNNVAYLCYTNSYYRPCQRQVAFLIQNFERELERDTEAQIQNCYKSSIRELKSRGFDVQEAQGDLDIQLELGNINVLFDAPTTVSTSSGGSSFETFEVEINSKLYKLLLISDTIIESEIHSGNSELDLLRLTYYDLNVESENQEGGSKIYTLENEMSGELFRFATRSYAFPYGFGLNEEFESGY